MELVVGGEAVVYRGKLWEAGFRASRSAIPGQLNVAFDAEDMRLSLLWRGRFLNAGPHWTRPGHGADSPARARTWSSSRTARALAVLADASRRPGRTSRQGELGLKFRGYQLDAAQAADAALLVRRGRRSRISSHRPRAGARPALRRTITFGGAPPANLHLRLAAGKLSAAGDNAWRLNDALTIHVRGGGKPVVRGEGDERNCSCPIRFDGEKARRLEVDYAW